MDAENKIDYIESPTKDIQKTKKFFEELFGWTFQDFGSDYTSYYDGRIRGGFYKAETTTSMKAGSVLVVFYTPTLEVIQEKVTQLGGAIVKDIFSFPGGRRFHFTDPGTGEFAVWSDK